MGHHHHHHHNRDQISPDVDSTAPRNGVRHGPHPMGPPSGFGRFGRGRRSRRGDVRVAVLLLLDEEARNGYQLIQEIESRSNGAWRPSPGSIYPVLAQLEDEGLAVEHHSDAGRSWQLSDRGRAEVTQRRESFGLPWETAAASVSEGRVDLARGARQTAAALHQVIEVGTDEQVNAAALVLKEARRSLYAILAEDSGA